MTAKKNGLNFFDKLILWLNYVLAAALLIGYLAPMVDPRKLWIIAFFGLAYPPVFLANLLFIVYWLFRKKPVGFAIVGLHFNWLEYSE
jgi:energy-coupling factor transporter transmembrane protein EcfT